MLARSSASVSNSLAARASSSSISRQHLLLHLAHGDLDGRARAVRERERDLLRLPGRRSDERRLDLGGESPAAQLDDRVRLRLAFGVDEIDDERVARLSRTLACRRELRDGLAERLDLGVQRLLRNLDLGARYLELGPVDELGERLHLDGRDEAPGLVRGAGKLELVLRVGDGPHAAS